MTPSPATTLHLVSCVPRKRDQPVAAKDLYCSDWFRKARAYVEMNGGPWQILSAEHGLVDPDSVIGPYEKILTKMGVAERKAWAARVLEQLRPILAAVDRVVFLAGARYREFLHDVSAKPMRNTDPDRNICPYHAVERISMISKKVAERGCVVLPGFAGTGYGLDRFR